MKNLQQVISEKLRLTKHIDTDIKYPINDFIKLVNKETDLPVNIDIFDLLGNKSYLGGNEKIKDVVFIDITENNDEFKYYKDEIIGSETEEQIQEWYALAYNKGGYLLNYVNLNHKDEPGAACLRYGYIVGNDIKAFDKTKIFKITLDK